MAEEIVGTEIKDAPPKAGLLIQHYPVGRHVARLVGSMSQGNCINRRL